MKKRTICLLSAFILFQSIVLLLINSADFLLDEFGDLNFSTVVYQLSSPLVGTGQGIVNSYINKCVGKTAAEVALILCICLSMCMGFRILDSLKHFYVVVRIKEKIFNFKITKKIVKILWSVTMLALMIIEIWILWGRANSVGLPAYVKSVVQKSQIFEQEYIAPDTVNITFPNQKRNLILLYIESMEATYFPVEEGGGKENDFIPELTQLAKENISFSDSEKLGGGYDGVGEGWTMAALLSSSSGVPYKLPINGNSAGDYEEFMPGIVTLGDILLENGYNNYFLCGSDAIFGGRKLYFEKHGDYSIYDYNTAIQNEVIPSDYYEFWGFEDCKLYDIAKDELSRIAMEDEPFNYTMLTVDTHHPQGYECELCQNQHGNQFANSISCASRQAAEFIEWVQKQEWYENTSIVVVGDHLSMHDDFWNDLPADYERKKYNCFINAETVHGADKLNTKNRVFSSIDLFPTILSSMEVGIEGNRLGLGVDLFSGEKTLAEEYGVSELEQELSRHSQYYNSVFIQNNSKYREMFK